jgi:hypothetical protein
MLPVSKTLVNLLSPPNSIYIFLTLPICINLGFKITSADLHLRFVLHTIGPVKLQYDYSGNVEPTWCFDYGPLKGVPYYKHLTRWRCICN